MINLIGLEYFTNYRTSSIQKWYIIDFEILDFNLTNRFKLNF